MQMCISLMSEPVGSTLSYLCLFHPWYKPRCFWAMMNGPNQGIGRTLWDALNSTISGGFDGLWSEFYTVIWESTVDMRCHLMSVRRQFPPRSTSWSLSIFKLLTLWTSSKGSEAGYDRTVYTRGCFVRRVCLGRSSLHLGNKPAAFGRLATQPSR